MEERPLLFLTNDDGVMSRGLTELRRAFKDYRIKIVAPDRERSAVSHSLTIHHPIRVDEIEEDLYATDGTPADCVNLGINGLLDGRPDLVISGINGGPNLGDDVLYSGTVSAAMEGVLLGIPSFAISMADRGQDLRYETACYIARRLVKLILREGLPPYTLLNVNVPNIAIEKIKGVSITRLGKRVYREELIKRFDPRGKVYYWIGPKGHLGMDEDGTDFMAIKMEMVSITPLHLDFTNYDFMEPLKNWKIWEGFNWQG